MFWGFKNVWSQGILEAIIAFFLASLISPIVVSFIWGMDIHRNVTIEDYLGLLFMYGLICSSIIGYVKTALTLSFPLFAK